MTLCLLPLITKAAINLAEVGIIKVSKFGWGNASFHDDSLY